MVASGAPDSEPAPQWLGVDQCGTNVATRATASSTAPVQSTSRCRTAGVTLGTKPTVATRPTTLVAADVPNTPVKLPLTRDQAGERKADGSTGCKHGADEAGRLDVE